MFRTSAWVGMVLAASAQPVIPAVPATVDHWSFKPFSKQALPQVRDARWPRGRVDRFVLSALEARGLAPNPEADAATLLRRAFFDLTGLPPRPEEIEAFVHAPDREADGDGETRSPGEGAWAALLDRLLASPEFGARWGRHWLDVARFAETSGNTRNMAYVLAWRYRNYVVRSLNRDTPFDEFAREQIAGDLLPPASDPARRDEQLLATGFLNVGVKSLGEQDMTLYDMNVADEQITATTQAFLGLSANCARCHDHKFDPIPASDYHALAGIFLSTRNLSGVQTNNVTKEADAMPLGPDGRARLAAVKKHEEDLAAMQKDYIEVAKKRSAMRDDLVKAGFDPAKARGAPMPPAMEEKMKTYRGLEESVTAWQKKLADKRNSTPAPPALGMSVCDAEKAVDCPVYEKGEIKKPLAPVKRGALTALPVSLAPIGPGESGRRQLADWITSPANPLTARVIVNRVWSHVFGRGLVDTPDDFGRMGSKPSHPELLDDLAARFVEGGWSVKALIRELMLSRAYRMSSASRPDATAVDPSNSLLWRANRKRLEAEAVRDAVLALGGSLDTAPREGSPVADLAKDITPQGREVGRKHFLSELKDDSTCRSLYLPVVRGAQMPMMQCFNAADPGQVIGARSASITPAQSLLLMNSDLVMEQARRMAVRVAAAGSSDEERITRVWLAAYGRAPSSGERESAGRYLAGVQDRSEAWSRLCHALMQSGEFQIVY